MLPDLVRTQVADLQLGVDPDILAGWELDRRTPCSLDGVRPGRLTVAFLAVAVALVAPLPVGAKEGVEATFITNVPLDAEPGNRLRLAWTLTSVDEDGQRRPFGASGVYVRLLSASGAAAETGFARTDVRADGEYAATVAVPEGGIGDVKIGLVGWVSDPRGTRRSDAFFPITNDPLPGAARVGGQSGSDANAMTWILLGVAGVVLSFGIAAVVLRRRLGGRARAATQASGTVRAQHPQ